MLKHNLMACITGTSITAVHVQACTAYECQQGCQKKVLELSQGYIMQQENPSRAEQDATYSVKSSPAIVQLRFVMTHVLSCTKPALQKAFIMLSQVPVVAWHGKTWCA